MKEFGAKARGLRELSEAGLQVPDFVEWVFNSAEWKADKEKRNLLIQQKIDGQTLPDYPLLVRSNLGIEDGKDYSFAGIFESSNAVHNQDELVQALMMVIESYQSERALHYLSKQGQHLPDSFPVLIQSWLEPDWSGVMFTTLPEYPDEVAIHLVAGHNRELLSGGAEGESHSFNRRTGEWISSDTPAFLNQLVSDAEFLEEKFSHPLDIEFGVQDGKVFYFQKRPVTQKIAERIVLDNSNIQESYAGISSPLTFSFARMAYATVYKQTMKVMRIAPGIIDAYQPVLENLLYSWKGRIYYHIENWYKGLLLLPSFKQNKSDMEAMMGLQESVDFIENDTRSFMHRLVKIPGIILTYSRLLLAFARLDKATHHFRQHFKKEFEQFRQLNISGLSDQELQQSWLHLDEVVLTRWETPIINDFYVMMMNGRLKRKWKGDEGEEKIHRLLGQDMQIESMAPLHFYRKIADKSISLDGFKTRIDAGQEMHAWVKEKYPPLAEEIDAFIMSFGDRVVGELKMETITLREDPELFYSLLKGFLSSVSREKKEGKMEKANSRLFEKLKKGIERREALRMDRTRLFGMYRSIFLEIGTRLEKRGILAHARDVFYLEQQELRHFDQFVADEVQELVHTRKQEYEQFQGLKVPGHVVLPHRIFQKEINVQGQLQGEGIVGDRVEGVAVVYSMDGPIPDLKDKILCAPRTDPGWVPLFPACKAVLIEKGSSLSHSVIVLREIGIPCMINIQGLTDQIQSGDRIEVDIMNGRIKKKE